MSSIKEYLTYVVMSLTWFVMNNFELMNYYMNVYIGVLLYECIYILMNYYMKVYVD